MIKLINILLVFLFTGCTALQYSYKEEIKINSEQIESFKDLLKEGWVIRLSDDKVILVKYTDNTVYILDVFNILGDNNGK